MIRLDRAKVLKRMILAPKALEGGLSRATSVLGSSHLIHCY